MSETPDYSNAGRQDESRDYPGTVDPDEVCPNCGEDLVDNLVWEADESDVVRCATCGTLYAPGYPSVAYVTPADDTPHCASSAAPNGGLVLTAAWDDVAEALCPGAYDEVPW